MRTCKTNQATRQFLENTSRKKDARLLLARVNAFSMHHGDDLPHTLCACHLNRLDRRLVGKCRSCVQTQCYDPQPADAPQCSCLGHVQFEEGYAELVKLCCTGDDGGAGHVRGDCGTDGFDKADDLEELIAAKDEVEGLTGG